MRQAPHTLKAKHTPSGLQRHSDTNGLVHIVIDQLKKRTSMLAVTKKHNTPFYLYDRRSLIHDIREFQTTMSSSIPNFSPYYAFKINPYPKLIRETIKAGYGLDVASGWELSQSLHLGCTDIVYYSPGKTDEEIELAVNNNKKVRIHVDSFQELERIGRITKKRNKLVRIGVRLHLSAMPQWAKFGIGIANLATFWRTAKKYPWIRIEGIHFHASRNKNATPYQNSIKELAAYLSTHFTKSERKEIKYIDIGGGFEAFETEGYYPYEFSRDASEHSDSSYDDVKRRFSSNFKVRDAIPLTAYAQNIGNAIRTYLAPLVLAQYFAEPGRIICNNAMHIVLTVVDIKDNGVCIVDGGINMVGWQRYMYEYFPVINLTRPSHTSIPMTLYGKLCTTRDLWGYSCFAQDIQIGDKILIPNQGALTYAIAQNWIMQIPEVYSL